MYVQRPLNTTSYQIIIFDAIDRVRVDVQIANRYNTRYFVSGLRTLHSCPALRLVIWYDPVLRSHR